jgi:TonB family protein
MSQQIFEQLVEKPKSTKKWLFLSFSILFHGLVIVSVIVYPLMSSALELPKVKVITVSLAAPSPPPIPVGRKGGGGRKKVDKKAAEQAPPPPVNTGRPVAPPEIPEDIAEESLESFRNGQGYGPGIDGAVDGIENGIDGAQTLVLNPPDLTNQAVTRLDIRKPRLIRKVEPLYPKPALLARKEGTVIIEAATDIYGKVINTRIITGHPLLRTAAVEAVEKWIYEPYIIDGIPKPVIFTVNVTFKLQR